MNNLLEYLHINLLEASLLGALLLVWLYQLYFYTRYMAGVLRVARRERKGKIQRAATLEPVSVIVCARNEQYNLTEYLYSLLVQDYPQYEVIVVDDGSEDDTKQLIATLQQQFPHLRTTFVPTGARLMSSKKLALTLGAKAAQYDYLLLIDADCRPASNHWIHEMMLGFTDDKEIILGYGAYFAEPTLVNRLIQYDTLFIGLQYLGMAAAGHPYMGVGRNLAYRKSTFFGNGGFAGLLGERAGDDDLFVNKVAKRRNTAVIVSRDSVTWSVPKPTLKLWWQQKERHLSVSGKYRFSTRFRLTLEPLTRFLFYGLIIAIGVYGSLYTWLAAACLFLTRLLWQIIIINGGARHFQQRTVSLNLIFYDIYLPLNSLALMLRHKLRRKPLYW